MPTKKRAAMSRSAEYYQKRVVFWTRAIAIILALMLLTYLGFRIF